MTKRDRDQHRYRVIERPSEPKRDGDPHRPRHTETGRGRESHTETKRDGD